MTSDGARFRTGQVASEIAAVENLFAGPSDGFLGRVTQDRFSGRIPGDNNAVWPDRTRSVACSLLKGIQTDVAVLRVHGLFPEADPNRFR